MLQKPSMTLGRCVTLAAAFGLMALTGCGNANPPDGCLLGQWRGSYVTEAVNVQLDVTISGLGLADSGDWSFTGADDIALGSGDVQAWQMGSSATIIIFTTVSGQPGSSNGLVGEINGACDHIEGDISGGNIGHFSLDRMSG